MSLLFISNLELLLKDKDKVDVKDEDEVEDS
jgi:hypothetical protein